MRPAGRKQWAAAFLLPPTTALTAAPYPRRIKIMTTETLQSVEAAVPAQPRSRGGRWAGESYDILPMPLSKAAKLSAIDKATLHKILTGKRRAHLDHAVALADTIGMPLADLADYLMSRTAAA